ncbi:hypothetical protein [Runella slithyformis]|uniref:Uncharacterized protein n=1 Tax=Runella slithyformis (strain ATCC 29530 / DSM 19594 / LMG 11500 / NCIMB 11436 / LSU 4) TaxID=761193 RepID=A0A7U3ZNH2_RUNSL|nr:hypothetical protein [Runella slithyformis]AEI50465.1 hypothetical protein Runsl_4118 [Runella slithyformis DSM 19594]
MKNSKPKNLIASSVITVIVISLVVCILVLIKRTSSPSASLTSFDTSSTEPYEKTDSVIAEPIPLTKPKVISVRAGEKAFYQKKLAGMTNNFTLDKDDFQDKGWYTHKNFGKKAAGRKTLKAHVREDGFICLESQWYGNDWIFHNHIKVRVGSLILSSPKVETYDRNNKQESTGSHYWENIYYRETGDNGIIQAIADSTSKPVKVRFEGRKFNHDIVLTHEEKRSLKESHELSEILKKINR